MDEFQMILEDSCRYLAKEFRPSLMRRDYSPHNFGEPVSALIIGEKWAAFPHIREDRRRSESIRVEEIVYDTRSKYEDPSRVCEGGTYLFSVSMILQMWLDGLIDPRPRRIRE